MGYKSKKRFGFVFIYRFRLMRSGHLVFPAGVGCRFALPASSVIQQHSSNLRRRACKRKTFDVCLSPALCHTLTACMNPAAANTHHHQITQLSHSINAIGPTRGGRKRAANTVVCLRHSPSIKPNKR
jgi:hypothetical protein